MGGSWVSSLKAAVSWLARKARRRTALKKLSSAISYMTREFVSEKPSAAQDRLMAIKLLLALNRAVYYDLDIPDSWDPCREVECDHPVAWIPSKVVKIHHELVERK